VEKNVILPVCHVEERMAKYCGVSVEKKKKKSNG